MPTRSTADVAELADALDLGSSGATRAGSIPVIRIQAQALEAQSTPTENARTCFEVRAFLCSLLFKRTSLLWASIAEH